MQHTRNSQPNLAQHLRTENRLTKLEDKTADHGKRISAMERGGRPKPTLRDWILSAGTVAAVLGALLHRISLSDALSLISGMK